MPDDKTIAAYDLRVDDYVRLTKRTRPHATLTRFIARVPPNGRVLDLGCGPANAAAVMRDHGLRVDAVDASAEMVRLANATHDIGARVATFETIDAVDAYDGVWANFSLLHASPADFPCHLRALHRALVPDGIFHIGMKLGSGEARIALTATMPIIRRTNCRAISRTPDFSSTGSSPAKIRDWRAMSNRGLP